jgi:hypothetical protein
MENGSCSTDFGEDDFGQRFPEIALRTVVMLLDIVEDPRYLIPHLRWNRIVHFVLAAGS